MSKSTIILLALIWVLCTLYYTLAKAYEYPYANIAMAGTWVATVLLLVCILRYIRAHKRK